MTVAAFQSTGGTRGIHIAATAEDAIRPCGFRRGHAMDCIACAKRLDYGWGRSIAACRARRFARRFVSLDNESLEIAWIGERLLTRRFLDDAGLDAHCTRLLARVSHELLLALPFINR